MPRVNKVVFAFCSVFALGVGLGLSARTQHATAAEPAPPPTPKADPAAQPADFVEQITALEKKIAEQRKVRANAAWGCLLTTKRIYILKSALRCGAGVQKDLADDLKTFERFQQNFENATASIHACQRTYAKLHGVSGTGSLVLNVRSSSAFSLTFSLTERDATGNEIVTVNVHDETTLAKVLARAKASPTAPTKLHVVECPSVSGYDVMKTCAAVGYKTVTFTGLVAPVHFAWNLPKDEYGNAPGCKLYEEVELNPAKFGKEIDDAWEAWKASQL